MRAGDRLRTSWRRWRLVARGPSGEPADSRWGYLLFAVHLASLAAIGLSNVLLGLAALVAPWRRLRRAWERAGPLLIVIGLYLAGLLTSILASHDPRTSARASSDLFNFLVPIVALVVLTTAPRARLVARLLVAVGSLIALQALLEFSLGGGGLDERSSGPFSHYMTLGGFLVLVDCFLLGWMASGGWRRPSAWVAFGLIQAALLVSYTRNAWIALAVLLTLVAAAKAPKLLIAWIPVAVLLALLAPNAHLSRFGSIFDLRDPSNYDRLCMGYAGLAMVRDKPLFGQGPRMVRERYSIYRHPTSPRRWVPHLHNSFLNVAAERGLVSLGALLALLLVPARSAWRRLRSDPDGEDADLLVTTLLVVIATLVTGLFEDYWSDTEIQRLVLFSLALPYCLPARRGDAPRDPTESAG